MGGSVTTEALGRAEGLLVDGQDDVALELLAAVAADAEEYVDRNCPTTDELQWFCFPTPFELLAYRRVEGDRRELRMVGEPLDRLYADLALAQVRTGDEAGALESLKQAVRWNPMECAYRLDLAELFRRAGDEREWLGLAFSVFARASRAAHLVRAYLAFATHFGRSGDARTQAACLRAARRVSADDAALVPALELAAGTPADPDALDDAACEQALAEAGIPSGASTDLVVCMLMCATDAARDGDARLATDLTVRAYGLVGAPAAEALIALIREGDAELERGRGDGGAA